MPTPHRQLVLLITRWRGKLHDFPVIQTLLTLVQRFREDRLGLTAGSLTFTTVMALVPFFAVALAVFSTFPIFGKLEGALQQWLMNSFVPGNIASQVLDYLTQFAQSANRLGLAGFSVLLITAVALVLTIDTTLNKVWRVRRPRPLGQRLLIYWTALTLGPLLFGASLSVTSYALSATQGIVSTMPGGLALLLDLLQFLILFAGLTLTYRMVPNMPVQWRHAAAGGLFAAMLFEGVKKLLVLYLSNIPTYSVIYGAFATVPILLLWIYLVWVIVLLGAVVAAYLPSLLAGVLRHTSDRGWQFQLAIEVLQQLHRAHHTRVRGLSILQLAQRLRVDPLQLEPVLDTLAELDITGTLDEFGSGVGDTDAPRHVLLVDPDQAPLAPLVGRLLLPRTATLAVLWERTRLDRLRLRDVLN
ncbi:MAG: YihY family inner membrane protein [Burkholderiales bacterium]